MKNISLLGSTGSIGVATLDIVSQHPGQFCVLGLAAGSNLDLLVSQIEQFSPQLVSVRTEADALQLRARLTQKMEIVFGDEGACQVASLPQTDMVVSAIVGAAGLLPTMRAIAHKKTIGLANKEAMVIAGEIMRREASKNNVTILPIDSEHSALFQCLEGNQKADVKRLVLTASGGPFLHYTTQQLKSVTLAQALKHPNWAMGAKITIDSASMMNKGLEVMEARWLFDFPSEKIDICVHPQSIIHSMVEYCDGSVMAQMGIPDMKVPIAYALSYPKRITTGTPRLDLFQQKKLEFFKPDFDTFPCLQLAYDAAKQGGSCPAVLNAANEIVVDAFLKERISFLDIPRYIAKTMGAHQSFAIGSIGDVIEADRWAREYTREHF